MPEYGFHLTAHDPDRPWIVPSTEHRTVTLEGGVSFFEWSRERWPAERLEIELDPWQLAPDWR